MLTSFSRSLVPNSNELMEVTSRVQLATDLKRSPKTERSKLLSFFAF